MKTTKGIEFSRVQIKKEFLDILEQDERFVKKVLEIIGAKDTGKKEREDHIDRILAELKLDRERQDKKWDENQKKWDENQKKWDEIQRKWDEKWDETQRKWDEKWDENQKKWDETQRKWDEKWDENQKKWEETQRKWDEKWDENQRRWNEHVKQHEETQREWNKKWDENQGVINEMLASIKHLEGRFDQSIGSIGARWGIYSETSFRNGLKAILEDSFKVKVERYEDYDTEGKIFGKPDQVELDVIIHNGILILCEIKSSVSKSDIYAFWRKKEFYEIKHGSKASRVMVISPMVDPKAQKVADELGIEVYSFADKVKL